MKDQIKKLRAKLAGHAAAQAELLAAAQADGVAEDAKASALDKWDAIAKEADADKQLLKRLEATLVDQEAAVSAAAAAAGMSEPHSAGGNARPVVVPASARRHGQLVAYKGATATEDAYLAGRWAAATIYGHRASAEWLDKNQGLDVGATLTTRDNGGAAYFVPTVVETAVVELMLMYGAFRRLAEVVPMSSLTKVTPRWTGTMIPYFVAEGQKPTQTDPAWDAIEVTAKDLAAMTKISRDLDEDSLIDLGDKITTCMAQAFALKEDQCGFFGDGGSAYGGIVGLVPKLLQAGNAASLVPCLAGHSSAQTITLSDFLNLVGLYPNYAQANPVWFCSKWFWANSMAKLELAAGGVRPDDIAAAGRKTFLGYPVELIEVFPKAAAAAGSVPILFGDLKLSSKLGDRRAFRVESGFENDDFTRQLRTLLATERMGITNHTIVDPRDSTQPGPILGLQLTA